MKMRSLLSLLAMCALIAAGAAFAAGTPAPKPATDGERHVERVVIQTDGQAADLEDMDELGWLDDDDQGIEGAGGPGGGGDVRREVIVRRMGGAGGAGGPGMMHGGMGMAGHGGQCDESCPPGMCASGGAGGHKGMGHGMAKGGPGMGRGGMGHPAMMFAMLDLSDAQKAKMRDIHERQARLNIQAKADLQIARMDMAKLMRADKPDQPSINAQIDKMSQMRAGMQKSRVATMLEARAQLTPDQLKKMQEMRAKGPMGMHPGMGGGMGMGGHPGMGMHPGMGAGDGTGPHGPMAAPKPKGK